MKAPREEMMRLVKTAKGQLEGVLKMMEEDRYCMDILNQLLAARKVVERAQREILIAHVNGCVSDAIRRGTGEQSVQEIRTYLERL